MENINNIDKAVFERLLYFSNNYSETHQQYCKKIIIETWSYIPTADKTQIENNLEFIICKRVEDIWRNETPACTLLCNISQRCFIIFDPFFSDLKRETIVHILAHELAHVFYNHPKLGYKKELKDEIIYIEKQAEPQAYELTLKKWNIFPHQDDINRLAGYQKYFLNKT